VQSAAKSGLTPERLKARYGSDDPLTAARNALKSSKAADAVTLLESIDDNAADQKLKTLILFEAYLDAGRTKDALFIANSQDRACHTG
jgi:hypothetical protein